MTALLAYRHANGVGATLIAELQSSGAVRLTLAVRAGSRAEPRDIPFGTYENVDDAVLMYVVDRMEAELVRLGFTDVRQVALQ